MKKEKFIHFTDSHHTNNPPLNRIDNYNESIMKKVDYIVEYASAKKVDGIIHTGDLWDTYKPTIELFFAYFDRIRSLGIPYYYIYGNHDIQGANTDYTDKTIFGIFNRFPKQFICVANNPVNTKTSTIFGYNYSVKDECNLHWQYPVKTKLNKILLTHPMITREKSILIDGKYRQVNYKEVTTNADLMLCGHYHGGFEAYQGKHKDKNFIISNPGSLSRLNLKEARESLGPRFSVITSSKNKINVKYINIPSLSIDEIFDVEALNKKRKDKQDKSDFKSVLEQMSTSLVMGENFALSLKSVLKTPPKKLKKNVNKRTIEICNEAIDKYVNKEKIK